MQNTWERTVLWGQPDKIGFDFTPFSAQHAPHSLPFTVSSPHCLTYRQIGKQPDSPNGINPNFNKLPPTTNQTPTQGSSPTFIDSLSSSWMGPNLRVKYANGLL